MTEKKKSTTILLSALDNYGGHPFDEIFDVVFPTYSSEEVEAAHELSDKVAVVIWGGADISPAIYGQRPNSTTGPTVPSRRDQYEMDIAYKAIDLKIPIIGICRGAQLMCALSGGTLVQDVSNHAGGWHGIKTLDGQEYKCPSLHHQMMYIWDKDGKRLPCDLIAWASPLRSEGSYFGEPAEGIDDKGRSLVLPEAIEPEIVWFPHTKSLCIQSHPEFITDVKHPFVQYCLDLVKEKCGLVEA
jgi:GMP synthase-like glutamine amidotransferase